MRDAGAGRAEPGDRGVVEVHARARATRRRRASRAGRRTRPACSRTAPGRTPPRRRSRRGGCAAARPCAGPARRPRVISVGGDRERRARRDRDPHHRVRRRVVVAVDRRPRSRPARSSMSSTTSSGGSPPGRLAEVHRAAARVEPQARSRAAAVDLGGEQVAARRAGRRSGGRWWWCSRTAPASPGPAAAARADHLGVDAGPHRVERRSATRTGCASWARPRVAHW